jgi:hypothetical protein
VVEREATRAETAGEDVAEHEAEMEAAEAEVTALKAKLPA